MPSDGALLRNAIKLAMEINGLNNNISEKQIAKNVLDEAHSILGAIIGFEPPIESMSAEEWIKWDNDNRNRL